MQLAKVVGTVVSTRKEDALIGYKLLILEVIDPRRDSLAGELLVAVDTLGAGNGENVLIVRGGAARVNLPLATPLDARVVGIVDTMDVR
jgi:ethanolamine utilization protein EutN